MTTVGVPRRRIWQPWALLAGGLIVTAVAAHYTKSGADVAVQREFDFGCNEIKIKIQDRLNAHEQILRSGAAFFDHAGGVSREDWHRFAERQKVDQQLPGIQGIGFALLIPQQNLAQHVQEIRAEGFPQYQVRPEGERGIYSSIIYLEPFTNRNLRAFGYDMFSEPIRRTAMERSRDVDAAALSGKVILVQETDTNVQAGTLMYVPVYRVGMAHDTIDQRRNALVGWVYSPYRMNDLMRGILGSWDLSGEKRIHLEVFDSDKVSSDTLLFDSQPNTGTVGQTSGLPVVGASGSESHPPSPTSEPFWRIGTAWPLALKSGVVSAGRQWTVRFTRTGSHLSAANYDRVWLVLFGGTSASVLLAGLFFSVLNTRFKALRMARELTEKLAQSEQSYRNQFANNSTVMLLIDPKVGAILDANAAAVSFYGYSCDQLTAMRITDINTLPPAEVFQDMSSIQTKKGQRFQFKHRLADSSVRDVDVSTCPIEFGGRTVLHSIVFDVTERKQAEAALQRVAHAAEQLHHCLELINNCADLDSALTCLMQNAMDSSGMDGAGIYLIEGQNAVLRHHTGLDTAFVEQLARLPLSTDYVKAALEDPRGIVNVIEQIPERNHLYKAFGFRHVYGVVLRLGEQPFGLLNLTSHRVESPSASDIGLIRILALETGSVFLRLKIEGQIRLSEERYRSLYAESRDAIMILSPDTGFLNGNPTAIRLFGCRDEREFTTQTSASLSPAFQPDGKPSADEAQKMMRIALEQGSHFFDWTHRRLDGTEFPSTVLLSRIGSSDQRLLQSTVRDITERKRVEDAKEKMELQNQQLQKSESLGRMAGAIAHHFNNQLQVVMMNLQMALDDLPKNVGPVENLAEAMLSARKAAKVSIQMLTYLGQNTDKNEPLDLSDACQRHLPMLRTVMPKNVVLETDLPTPGPAINANTNQIQQILTNLLTNACEAMGEARGVTRLTVKTVPTADIPDVNRFPIDFLPRGVAYACLEIGDSACGIAAENIDKLFDPFFSTKFTGRGLGLPVVLGIVRAHGGSVTVESQPGKGSVFRAFLPMLAEAIPQKPIPVAQSPKAAGGGTVLVVDDEPTLRQAVSLALKRFGFTVLAAEDGVEALEVFEQHRDEICCVLCDLTMPRMNGWDTLTALRKLVPDIPVILASGYSEAQVMAGNHPELPQAFLSKPYELPTLMEVIARVMKNPKG